MACVTLKRTVDILGSPHLDSEPLNKRRRCGPPIFNSLTSPSRGVVKRAKRKLEVDDHYSSPTRSSTESSSPFLNAAPPIETDKLVAKLGQELKRLQRKKDFPQVPVVTGGGGVGTGSTAQSSGNGTSSGHTPAKDQPLFSLKQVTTVCCRMMKEREEHIREEYDKVLTSKLAEQYDAFVKFSHDQVERRLTESAFSYVS